MVDTDVLVIGAGFTGLAAALHLARAGKRVMVVDAAAPGWGASGRNNGQVIPTLSRHDPASIIARHGEAGERFVALLRDSAGNLFDLIRDEGIEAEAEQTGWVQPVHSPGRMAIAEKRVAEWRRAGASVDLLSRDQLAAKLGTDHWHGGWWTSTGGHVNPLALVRGLVRATLSAGGQVYAHSPVLALARIRGTWVATLPRARLTAPAVVVATHAYGAAVAPRLLPDLARSIVPLTSWQMATAPIGETDRRTILPERSAVSDTHGDLWFMRWDARGRLVTGGAMLSSIAAQPRLKARVATRLARLFPALEGVRFDHVWNGKVALTRDGMPHIHQIGPDGYAWVGCNGRALALSHAIGREFARAILGADRRDLALPFTEPVPIPWQPLVRTIAPLNLLRHRWRDAREM
jgi:glycine/D-amino acid oxidase-like deaminating enzyme